MLHKYCHKVLPMTKLRSHSSTEYFCEDCEIYKSHKVAMLKWTVLYPVIKHTAALETSYNEFHLLHAM